MATKLLVGIAFVLIAPAFLAQTVAHAPPEQIAFLSAHPFPPSAPIPQDVVRVLLKEEEVRDSIDRASDAEKQNPAQLFRATEVHLFSPNEIDLFLVGNAPLAGADNGWFWVVRSAHDHPQVVLFATGYVLKLLHPRTNGYRDIRCTWSSPNGTETKVYKFNRTKYQLWKERWNER